MDKAGGLEAISNNQPIEKVPLLNPISEKSKNSIKNKLKPFFKRNKRELVTLEFGK